MVDDPTRRTFLRQAGAGLLSVPLLGGALAGCGGNGDDGTAGPEGLGTVATEPPDSAAGDADLLNRALATEYTAIAAYNAGAPLLEGKTLAAAERFLVQERRHAARLRGLIDALGATPEDPRPSYDFGRPDRAADVLRLLQDVERESIAAYVEIVPRLTEPDVRQTVASIVTNDAEHLAVVREQMRRWPVPSAFVTGLP
ncbi:ferritin-like domain-containing protein [Conexibacter woesei]|uniref:DUF4439 domain-containing protein n=1 Tax=Conexibacter woesei (strain DSM 14684 / CCUG 47730 / CIP 108061 / JCM 11494 / NBRC 100937 / ID131577) TaxID=469383 RepID=D3F298_CONWI|nr:ferritin-like domain-containing protein [Conexibacter woesei]ADB50273.1 hypothetical protein Cwoe_1847 [Conexibacter woesei DSM 14684]